MGFGAIMVNLPMSGVLDQLVQGKVPAAGIIQWLYKVGIESSEMMPTTYMTSCCQVTARMPSSKKSILSSPFLFPLCLRANKKRLLPQLNLW